MPGDPQSIPFYKKAIELDPDFALAYARLGAVYSNVRESWSWAANVSRRPTPFAIT